MDVIRNAAYQSFLGLPLIGWIGIITYLLMWATALVMILSRRKIVKIKPKVHFRLAYITVAAATVHGLFAVAVYV
ncbi:MAG: hypothetical protein WCR91_00605 [Sphaerochaetaceae bacterium]|nr:hypothetical protein [Sphaerochaetaceae bacterium]MDX9810472.1 hypothetical protein [Sphaerochaetaceae bacterium]NLV83809.1 hypothetical protein [Spirochaetales bacterium]